MKLGREISMQTFTLLKQCRKESAQAASLESVYGIGDSGNYLVLHNEVSLHKEMMHECVANSSISVHIFWYIQYIDD